MTTRDFFPGAEPVSNLIEALHKLPGIGPKSAQRLTYHLIRSQADEARALAEAVLAVKERIQFCSECQNITETNPCALCSDPSRDRSILCIVEEPLDALAMERTRSFKGLYHVLHGAINPMNNIGPENLKFTELLNRLDKNQVREVILATNPNMEGNATALYLHKILEPRDIRVTRLATGLPMGGDLEYADELTLARAFEGRRDMS
jgi:recombination protein RecR